MATSKFEKMFTDNNKNPLLGATIEIIPQANTYPTGKITLNEHPTRKGWYYKDGVPLNEYKIYVNGTLYTQHVFHSEMILHHIAALFDEDLQFIGELEKIKSGVASFTGTANSKIVSTGMVTDGYRFFAIPVTNVFNPDDSLRVEVNPDTTITVRRGDNGTSGLSFFWVRIKPEP
jgi:hypothetical protein